MIRFGLTGSTMVALYLERPSMALVFAVLAVAWALPSKGVLRAWLGWDEAVARAADDDTLFSGGRDDA